MALDPNDGSSGSIAPGAGAGLVASGSAPLSGATPPPLQQTPAPASVSTSAPAPPPPALPHGPATSPPPGATVTMLDPTGTARTIPASQQSAALAAGGKLAIKMLDPTGQARWVPSDQQQAALAAGGKIAATNSVPDAAGSAPAAQGWRDHVISYLTRPSSGADSTTGWSGWTDGATTLPGQALHVAQHLSPVLGAVTGNQQPMENQGRQILGGAASLLLHPVDSLVGTGKLIAGGVVAAMNKLLPPDDLERMAKDHPELLAQQGITPAQFQAQVDNMRQQGGDFQASIQQIAHQFKHDPDAFLGQQEGQLLAGEAVGGVAGALGDVTHGKLAGIPSAGDALTDMQRSVTGTTPTKTGGIVQDIAVDNEAAINAAAEADAKAAASVAKKNADALNAHMTKIDGIRADNAAAEDAYQARIAKAKGDAAQNAADAQQAITEAQDADSQRGQLRRQELEYSNRLARRVQQVAQTAHTNASAGFDQVRNLVDDVPAQQEAAAQAQFQKPYAELEPEQQVAVTASIKPRTTPIAPLIEAVAKAQSKYASMPVESHKLFEDILSKGQTDSADAQIRDQSARGLGYPDFEAVPAGAMKDAIAAGAEQAKQAYAAARGEEPDAVKGIDFQHLRGLSSDLGKAAYATQDGTLKAALLDVKAQADAMAQQLANEAGAGSKLRTAKKNWSIYKDVFEEPNGPSGSGSPVAKSLNAEDDFNAVKPFLAKETAVASRARRMLVGSPSDGPYYDPNAGKLVDNLQTVRRKLAALPKPTDTAKTVAASQQAITDANQAAASADQLPRQPRATQAGPAETIKPEPPAPEPIATPPPVQPKLTDLTPDLLQQLKETKIQKKLGQWRDFTLNDIRRIGVGTGSALLGIASIVAHAGSPWAIAGELGAAVGALGWSLTPKVLAAMLDSPKVIAKLSAPTLADFKQVMALPEAQRTGVAEAMAELERHAQNQGKLPAAAPTPWQNFSKTVLPAATIAATPGRVMQAKSQAAAAKQQSDQAAALADSLQKDLDAATGGPQ